MLIKPVRSLLIITLILVSACSTGGAPATDASEPPPEPTATPVPPTPEPTETPVQELQLPDTPSSAVLGVEANTTYKVDMATSTSLPFEESELPAAPGSVTAQWYISDGRYVVAYVGLDLSDGTAMCPGNSILTDAGFMHVSNAPTTEGACEGFPTLSDDPEVGPMLCGGTLLYVTAIPSDLQGMLFGTLEMLAGENIIVGITSAVQSSPDIPMIDLAALCG